jgi:hypothetical protein
MDESEGKIVRRGFVVEAPGTVPDGAVQAANKKIKSERYSNVKRKRIFMRTSKRVKEQSTKL